MSVEKNIALLMQAVEQWNAGDLEGYLSFYSDDASLHGYDVEPGVEGIRRHYERLLAAFPQTRVVTHDVFGADDRVGFRFEVHAVHRGAFHGVPASGKPVILPGLTIYRFAGGKCVERWSHIDLSSLETPEGRSPG